MKAGRGRAVAASVLTAFVVAGCASSTLERGDRVRLESPRFETNPMEGKVLAVGPDSLSLIRSAEGRTIAVPWGDISSLAVGHRPRRTWWGAVAGAVVGGVAGASLDEGCEGDSPATVLCSGAAVVGFAITGAGIGAIIGAFIRGEERWEPIAPDQVRIEHLGQSR